MAIIGQTNSPADKRIYTTRNIIVTVDSILLITASILAKKLAEGLDALVMDVKVGSGVLMPTLSRSVAQASGGVANEDDRATDRYESGFSLQRWRSTSRFAF